jgi:hypothetical protein
MFVLPTPPLPLVTAKTVAAGLQPLAKECVLRAWFSIGCR